MYLVPDSNGTSSLSSPVVDTIISLTYTEAASGSNANSSCCLCIPAYKAMLILHVYLQHYHLNESKRWRKDGMHVCLFFSFLAFLNIHVSCILVNQSPPPRLQLS